jgi:hypothetical protein
LQGYITDPSAERGLRLAEDLSEPEPASDEALVEVRAFAVNRGEITLLSQRDDEHLLGAELPRLGFAVGGADLGADACPSGCRELQADGLTRPPRRGGPGSSARGLPTIR